MRDSNEMAVGVGYAFNILPADCVAGIELKESGIVVTVNGKEYPLLKGATFDDSRKVDGLLDMYGQRCIEDFVKAQEPASSLESEAAATLAASAEMGTPVSAPAAPRTHPTSKEASR